MASFGENLKHIRTEKNISQGQLAQMINTHSSHVSRYERNLTQPTVEVVKKIAESLGVTTDSLIYGSGSEKAKNNIQDNDLLNMFSKIQALAKDDVDCIKNLLNAFLFRREMQQRLTQ